MSIMTLILMISVSYCMSIIDIFTLYCYDTYIIQHESTDNLILYDTDIIGINAMILMIQILLL